MHRMKEGELAHGPALEHYDIVHLGSPCQLFVSC